MSLTKFTSRSVAVAGAICLLASFGSVFVSQDAFGKQISLGQRLSASGLKTHCNAAGGEFDQNDETSSCSVPGGNTVTCDNKSKKCVGYVPLLTSGPNNGPSHLPLSIGTEPTVRVTPFAGIGVVSGQMEGTSVASPPARAHEPAGVSGSFSLGG